MARQGYVVLVIITVILVGGFLAYLGYQNSQLNATQNFLSTIQSKVDSFNVYDVNNCMLIMQQQNLTSALCTMLSDGSVVLHDNNLNCGFQTGTVTYCATGNIDPRFNPGDYIGLQVNLQKLNTLYPTYYACIQTDLPIYETTYPAEYGNSTAGISNGQFYCSGLLNESVFHHAALSGYVLNQTGNYTIMKIWIFNGSLGNIDFQNNLDKGLVVFDFQGEIV